MPVQCLGMKNFTELPSVPPDHVVPFTDQLRLAVAAYLARFKGTSREHTESDLRCYLAGARNAAWTRWLPGGRTWSYTSGECKKSAAQALHRIPAILRHGRVLPDLRPRRCPGALTRRTCPP